MLNVSDIEFLLSCLDQISFKGIEASLKLNEVFMKLNEIKFLRLTSNFIKA